MGVSINYATSRTLGNEVNISCSQCVGKTAHKIVASYDLVGVESWQTNSIDWCVEHQIVQCLGCKGISFRKGSSNSEDWTQSDEYGEREYLVEEEIYPPRFDGVSGLGVDANHLPIKVRHIYDETKRALSGQLYILTGIGLRALLEAVCVEKSAKGKNLLSQIDDLVSQSVLTPVSAKILHKIRTLGNLAAHEIVPHSDKQLRLAMSIVEHLLRDVYVLPKQVETEFGKDV